MESAPVNSLIEIVDRNCNGGDSLEAYLARRILNFDIKEKALVESYSLAVYFKGSNQTSHDHIASVITRKSRHELWQTGPLSDIMGAILLGTTERQEEKLKRVLSHYDVKTLEYHPSESEAQTIRKQFFARVRELERIAVAQRMSIYEISKKAIEEYRGEIIDAPEIEPYNILRQD